MTNPNPTRFLILSALLLAAAIGTIGYFTQGNAPGIPSGRACTLEAKVCPDGSSVGRSGPNCDFAACSMPSSTAPADTSGWNAYTNANFGFSLKYPSSWQLSEDGVHAATPYITLGNPIAGQKTYSLRISIVSTGNSMSAQDYVQALLKSDEAQDAANAKSGPAPQITPKFDHEYSVTVGSYNGYELSNVFEFDHGGEQIYVANNDEILIFDFPVADAANPNIASAAANNVLAHQIIGTLALTTPAGAFCGGIAAFSCPQGYTCHLDGTYPDAGGHCAVK